MQQLWRPLAFGFVLMLCLGRSHAAEPSRPNVRFLVDDPRPELSFAGHGLIPLLANPQAERSYLAFSVTGTAKGVTGIPVRSERCRYVEYDGYKAGAMLFDEETDPHELKSLVNDPKFSELNATLLKLAQ